MSLREVIIDVGQGYSYTREILLILIKNNIIKFAPKYKELLNDIPNLIEDLELVYHVDTNEVLQRIRFPYYIYHISKLYGDLGE